MGYNLHSCCHLCKVTITHYRKEEDKSILPFYLEHKNCAQQEVNNVQTMLDGENEQEWMYEYDDKKH